MLRKLSIAQEATCIYTRHEQTAQFTVILIYLFIHFVFVCLLVLF